MKPIINEYEIMEEAVRQGLQYAMRRYFKHRDTDSIKESEIETDAVTFEIANNIMNIISERFEFEGE